MSETSSSVYALLLLPPPPKPANAAAIRAAFEPTLDSVLGQLLQIRPSTSKPVVLDITVPCVDQRRHQRAHEFARVSSLLAHVYSLLHVLLDRHGVSPASTSLIDARLLSLAWDPENDYTPGLRKRQWRCDCLVDLPDLVESKRKWTHLFTVLSEQGEKVFRRFQAIANDIPQRALVDTITNRAMRVPGGLVFNNPSQVQQPTILTQHPHHAILAFSAFDQLTFSHKLLLTMTAFLVGPPSSNQEPDVLHREQNILVGIADVPLGSGSLPFSQSWASRRLAVDNFLHDILDFRSLGIDQVNLPGQRARSASSRSSPLLDIEYKHVGDEAQLTEAYTDLSAVTLTIREESQLSTNGSSQANLGTFYTTSIPLKGYEDRD